MADLVKDLQVVVENGGNDWDHVGLDDSGPHGLGASHANVDDALKGETPFPHLQEVMISALLEDADETFDATIDSENITDAGRRSREIGEMIQGVDQGEGRSAVESAAVVQGGSDIDSGLVDIGDAEVDFPHDEDNGR